MHPPGTSKVDVEMSNQANLSTMVNHGTKSSGFLCPDMADPKQADKNCGCRPLTLSGVLVCIDSSLVWSILSKTQWAWLEIQERCCSQPISFLYSLYFPGEL